MTSPAPAQKPGWIRKFIVGPSLVLLGLLGVASVVAGAVAIYIVYWFISNLGNFKIYV